MAIDAASKKEMKHGEMAADKHAHAHQKLDVSDWAMTPSVSMKIAKDAVGGWNVYLDVQHFKFSPENVHEENVAGEGHAHL